jgi:IPT/TIG domain
MTTPIQLPQANPGDLIRSDDWNAMTAAIDDLEIRVAALEAGGGTGSPSSPGAPFLNTRVPAGDLHVGDFVTLLGQNFLPLSQTRINFGGTQITSFGVGSDDTHLTFTVPNISPQAVSISVANPQGTSSTHLTANVIAALPPPIGDVDVQSANDPSNPPNPTAPGTVQLQWTVTSNTLVPDTYTFAPVLTNMSPDAAHWAIGLNASQKQINAGASFTVVATIDISGGATSADVALRVTSQSVQSRSKTTPPITLTVGEETPVSDSRIGLTVMDPQPEFDSHGNASNVGTVHEATGTVVLVAANVEGAVEVQVDFHDNVAATPVNYTFSSEVDDATHWHAEVANPSTLSQSHLNGQTTVLFNITNLATNANPNDATFTVRAAKLKSDATEDYVSFIPVAIRNAG